MPDAGLVAVEPGQKGRTRRTATRGVVELGETDALRRQTIQIRRGNLRAITSEIGKAHVVGHNQDDIGPAGGLGERRQGSRSKKLSTVHHASSILRNLTTWSCGFWPCIWNPMAPRGETSGS